MTDREARGMRFAIRFTQLRLQSLGAAVAQPSWKDSLPSSPFFCQVVVGHLAKLHSFHSGVLSCMACCPTARLVGTNRLPVGHLHWSSAPQKGCKNNHLLLRLRHKNSSSPFPFRFRRIRETVQWQSKIGILRFPPLHSYNLRWLFGCFPRRRSEEGIA